MSQPSKKFSHAPVVLDYDELNVNESSSGRMYVTPDGKKYPSITTVLGAVNRDGILEWRKRVGEEEANRISRHAATRGTHLHNIVEKYLRNEYESANYMPHVQALFNSIKPHLDSNLGDIVLQERALYSDHLGLAGRVDLVAQYKSKLSIVDFKTSNRVKGIHEIPNYFAQAAAYAIMFEERTCIPVPQIVIMMAVDNNPNAVIYIQRRDDYVQHLLDVIKQYNKLKLFGHV